MDSCIGAYPSLLAIGAGIVCLLVQSLKPVSLSQGSSFWTICCICCLCLLELLKSPGMDECEGRVGLTGCRVWLIGVCWSSLPAGGLPASWLVQLRLVGEGPVVLPRYLGPRDLGAKLVCAVQLQSVCRSSSEVMGSGWVWGWSRTYSLQGMIGGGWCWSNLYTL